jgi:hypothetical protein
MLLWVFGVVAGRDDPSATKTMKLFVRRMFMKNMSKVFSWLVTAGLLLTTSISIKAAVIYSDTASGSDLALNLAPLTAGTQYGDELNLAGTERQMQSISVQYYGVGTAGSLGLSFAGDVQLRLRVYVNNGVLYPAGSQLPNGYPTPGTCLYDSQWFSIATPADLGFSDNRAQVFVPSDGLPGDLQVGGVFIPGNTITLSLEVQGLGNGDQVGVSLYNPPTVGTSLADYWENDGTGWVLKTIPNPAGGNVSVNFACEITATAAPSAVPESFNTFAGLLIVFGLLFACGGFRRTWALAKSR